MWCCEDDDDHNPRAPLLSQGSPGTSNDPAHGGPCYYDSVDVHGSQAPQRTPVDAPYAPNPWAPTTGGASIQAKSASRKAAPQLAAQPTTNHTPEDLKVGVNVSSSTAEIRHAFLLKVYSILLIQLLGTIGVGALMMRTPRFVAWALHNIWFSYVVAGMTVITLLVLFFAQCKHPLNFYLLALFTIFEAVSVGVFVATFDAIIVMQALFITTGIFLGLTLFALQTKWDFSGIAPYLCACATGMFFAGIVMWFMPFNKTLHLIYAICGILVFSGYIVIDTQEISKRFSPDEYIMGAITLYLDFMQVFIYVLKLLGNLNEKEEES